MLSEEERERNRKGKNIQIIYDDKKPLREFKSFVPELYSNFSLSVDEFLFDFEDMLTKKYSLRFPKGQLQSLIKIKKTEQK